MLDKIKTIVIGLILVVCFQMKTFSQKGRDSYKYTGLGLTMDKLPDAACWGFSYERSYKIKSFYLFGTQESYTGGISPAKLDFGFPHPRIALGNVSLVNTIVLFGRSKVKAFIFLRTGLSFKNDYNRTGKLFNTQSAGINYNLINEPGCRITCKAGKTNIFVEAGYRFYNGRYHFGQASYFNGFRFTIGVCGFRTLKK